MKSIYFSKFRYWCMFSGFLFVFFALITSIWPNKVLLGLTLLFSLSLWSVMYEFFLIFYVGILTWKKFGLIGIAVPMNQLESSYNRNGFYTLKQMARVFKISIFQAYILNQLIVKYGHAEDTDTNEDSMLKVAFKKYKLKEQYE